MSESRWPTREIAQREGWFSRRHETDAEHRAHRAHYKAHRGKAGRQARAKARADLQEGQR